MAMESTIDKLYQMKLRPMANAYSEQRNDSQFLQIPFDERFAMLVDAEWSERRVNKRTRLLKGAGFAEASANIADVRYDSDRNLDKSQMLELSNCVWVKEHRNIILTGASGAGKTWLSCALGVAACSAFYTVKYTRMPELIDFLSIKKDDEWLKQKNKLIKCSLLIVDDWLLEPLNAKGARELLEIIEARHRNGSMIMCSQFKPSGWHERLGEGAIADAVVDRLVYNSYTIELQGEESMRKRMSGINN